MNEIRTQIDKSLYSWVEGVSTAVTIVNNMYGAVRTPGFLKLAPVNLTHFTHYIFFLNKMEHVKLKKKVIIMNNIIIMSKKEKNKKR